MTSRRATPTRNPIPMTRRLAGVLVAGAVLAGCGSGATEAPGQPSAQPTTPATTRHTTPNPHTDQPEPRYEFTLPEGDRSVSVNEAIAYDDLYHGRCDQVQSFLDGEPDDPHDGGWVGLLSPRNVLLFQAGIELCRGDVAAAKPWFDKTQDEYGWSGSQGFYVCHLYKAAGSVIRQRPQSDFECQGGEQPPWPTPGPQGRDDPRTDADEGAL